MDIEGHGCGGRPVVAGEGGKNESRVRSGRVGWKWWSWRKGVRLDGRARR